MHPKEHPELKRFGQLLTEAFARVNLRDPAEIGRLIAGAQERPERENIPYHPFVVEQWLNGAALPSAPAYQAINDLLDDQAIDPLDAAYENALMVEKPANEAGLMLKARLAQNERTMSWLSRTLAQNGLTYSKPAIHSWCHGSYLIPAAALPSIDMLLPPPVGEPSIEEFQRMEREIACSAAQTVAENSTDIHEALRAIRVSLGLSHEDFAAELTCVLGNGRTVWKSQVCDWERGNREIACKNIPNRRLFEGTDAITAYCHVLANHGFASWADQYQAHWRALLEMALRENPIKQWRTEPQPSQQR